LAQIKLIITRNRWRTISWNRRRRRRRRRSAGVVKLQ